MRLLAAVPVAALALFATIGWMGQDRVERTRMAAVAEAVVASGHAGPVEVAPMSGEACWRARDGFTWKTAAARGWACAGPGGEVRLQTEHAQQQDVG